MEKEIRIQDDLYQAVNGEWIKNAVIPEDRPMVGGFLDLSRDVEKLMMSEIKAFMDGSKTTDIKEFKEAIKLYQKCMDEKARNELGIKPILPLLEMIKGLKSIDDLNKVLAELFEQGAELPFDIGVSPDMQDATKHSLSLTSPSIILPDTTYYANPAAEQMLGLYANIAKQALAFTPLEEAEQATFIQDMLAFDRLLAKSVKSQVEWSEYVKCYNPTPLSDVQISLGKLDLTGLLATIYGKKVPQTIIVMDPRSLAEFSQYFNEENFLLFVHWSYVKTLLSKAPYLSTSLNSLSGAFMRALTGVQVEPPLDRQAYNLVSYIFAEPLGVYYGRTYFGEEAKADVIDIVKKIIETYKVRMQKNNFLEASTKAEAIKKLSTIEIKMGYPDSIRPIYQKLIVDENDSLYDAMQKISKIRHQDQFAKLYEPVDRSEWLMPGHMVNACYNPQANDITFPAAILQKPFYSLNQSESENLGGLGPVIAHEISHAFDNNGAHFDENGNIANWWTEKDYQAFEALTKDMVAQFDGIPFHGGKVNGELVVSENIADNGGMAVTLEIMHTLDQPDFKAYFMNYAKIWCLKAKEEIMQLLLVRDVHSPAELRANITPRNFSEWYEAFDVQPTDGMYIAPEKRIVIW